MCAHSFMYVQPYSALELWVGDVCVGGVYNVARNEERKVASPYCTVPLGLKVGRRGADRLKILKHTLSGSLARIGV